ADAARHLDGQAALRDQGLDDGAVVARSPGGVQVDHMDPLCARALKVHAEGGGIVGVGRRLLKVALPQADATSAEDVDGGDDQHGAYVDPEAARLGRLPVVRELKRDRYVLGLSKRLDHELERVLVLA